MTTTLGGCEKNQEDLVRDILYAGRDWHTEPSEYEAGPITL